jgi:hypothetical protein
MSFGRDLSCTTTLRTARFARGARLVAEAAYRRITTRRGLLLGGPEEEDYGIDVRDGIGSSNAANFAAALPGRVEAELEKDDRIQATRATATVVGGGPLVTIRLRVECETADGPFTLTLDVSEAGVAILGIQA